MIYCLYGRTYGRGYIMIQLRYIPSTCLSLLCLIVISTMVNAQGTVLVESFYSEALQQDRYISIYLPEGYENNLLVA